MSVSSQRCASMPQREATYPMKIFSNGWVQLEELHQSCWQTLRSWSCSSRLWRLTCMSWRTTGWLTTLSTTLSVLTKSSWFRLQVDLLTSPAGVTNQRAHSCLAQSHVLTERVTFLTTYRVSALLTISSQYILYQIWQRCLMIRAELSVLTVSNHFDILQPNDSERKWKGQS